MTAIQPPLIDADAAEPSSSSLLTVAWRRKSLLLLGLVVGLVLAALYYAQVPPTYQSVAQVLIIKKSGMPTPGTTDPRMSYYEDYVATHAVLIRSPLIVQRAVEKHQLGSLKSFEGTGDPTAQIVNALAILRDNAQGSATNVLILSYRGSVSDDCATILRAVIDSYTEYLHETYTEISQETLLQHTRSFDAILQSRMAKEKALEEFQKTMPALAWKSGDGRSSQEEWLIQVRSRMAGLIVRRAELQGHLDAIETAVKEKKAPETVLALSSTLKTDAPGGRNALEEQMLALLLQEQTLLADYGPDHPQVVSLRKRISLTRDLFTRGAGGIERGAFLGGEKKAEPIDPVQDHLRTIRQQLAEIEGPLKALSQIVEKEEGQARDLARYQEQARQLQASVAQEQVREARIREDLSDFRLRQDRGGYTARSIAEPRAGGKVAPVLYQIIGAGGMLGLLAGLGLAYLAESTDQGFRTPAEVRRRLGLPILGHVPLLRPEQLTPDAPHGLDPSLCAHHKPRCAPSEAYRGLRTALYFSTEGETHKVIQITSPNARDGKSTLTSNLAVAIAQSGQRVVIVDGDMRKPRQHRIFGITGEIGLAAVLDGQAAMAEAVQATAVPGVWLMPCGKRPDNPGELLTSPRLPELIDELRESYDFVLIDTPPALVVSDALAVAARVDGTLLVVRLSRNGRPLAERARELIGSVGKRILGIVVNGINPGSTNYDYNQQYSYGDYQYAYEYEEEEEGYYTAEADHVPAASDAPPPPADSTTPPNRWSGWFSRPRGGK